jgi:hypothetical protein
VTCETWENHAGEKECLTIASITIPSTPPAKKPKPTSLEIFFIFTPHQEVNLIYIVDLFGRSIKLAYTTIQENRANPLSYDHLERQWSLSPSRGYIGVTCSKTGTPYAIVTTVVCYCPGKMSGLLFSESVSGAPQRKHWHQHGKPQSRAVTIHRHCALLALVGRPRAV